MKSESDSDFLSVATGALDVCAPDTATATVIEKLSIDATAFDLLAIGKCAGRMMDAAFVQTAHERALTAVPRGYPPPRHGAVMQGEHPLPGEGSFRAGEAVLEFAAGARRPILLLVSGGGSACVEMPAPGVSRDDLLRVWDELLKSGMAITEMNRVRGRLSAIKAGGLGRLMPSGSIVLIHSDVPAGYERAVASSPAFADPLGDADLDESLRLLSARSAEVVRSAGTGGAAVQHRWYVTGSSALLVQEVARHLASGGWQPLATGAPDALDAECGVLADQLVEEIAGSSAGAVIVAGGEPRVAVRGSGRGGRCTELAARLVLRAIRAGTPIRGLALATDGVDGSSGLAGVEIDSRVWGEKPDLSAKIEAALERSETASLAECLGRPVIMTAGGNNLRDLLLLARG